MGSTSSTTIRHSLRTLAVLTLAGSLGGCAYGDREKFDERTPMADFGVGATIIMPGQSLPMDQATGRNSNLQSIGGARSEIEDHTKMGTRPDALGREAYKVPGAIIGLPVAAGAAAAGALGGGQSSSSSSPTGQSGSQISNGAALPGGAPQATAGAVPVQPAGPPDPHRDMESARLLDLERELAAQGGGGAALPPVPLPPVPLPGGQASAGEPTQVASAPPPAPGGGFSIADELARLQASIPPKTRHEAHTSNRGAVSAEPKALRGGVADRVSDRNRDGRPDHWVYQKDGQKVRELFDEDGDAAPDRTVYFDPKSGHEQSIEEDTNLDGRLDSWVEFREGKMARQRRDTDHDGFLDTWTFYRAGSIAREEQDLNGDGFRNRMAFYEEGRLVREREDRDGDGRVDRVTLYDEQEQVRQRDEDQDGDGLIDTRSYYEGGRLSRRELLEEALHEEAEPETLTEPVWDAGPQDQG